MINSGGIVLLIHKSSAFTLSNSWANVKIDAKNFLDVINKLILECERND